ncbi:unnamed protein product [Durusdinium trenchii]|uniref:Uncharacterized protein n=1 Tax=Durusdinium trenchii TaxID=1381693 RepID=A0ABP0NFL0_9DINO
MRPHACGVHLSESYNSPVFALIQQGCTIRPIFAANWSLPGSLVPMQLVNLLKDWFLACFDLFYLNPRHVETMCSFFSSSMFKLVWLICRHCIIDASLFHYTFI